ncbi:uncharacterized protein LOC141586802 [Silene latifolia]|uniref:uncharacterized protein LOC141586802 n=1 Tax=Silene latifolia TaxID=37657 RepID=UPI003D776508
MARETRTLRELTALNFNVQPLCITFPALDDGVTFESKSGLIHQLPSFSGTSTEDPNKHLSNFHIVCTSMKPPAITDELLQLRAFPFTLKGSARDWLNYLPPGSITTWVGMKKAFYEKYFPPSRSAHLKRAINNVEQQDGETMYEYLEKFKQLCGSCPYHGYSDQDLILYFCVGLNQDDRRMIHSACGGNIANKNPDEAWEVITELAETSRQFERRPSRRGVSAMGVSPGLEEKVDNIASTLHDILSGRQMATVCGICCIEGHPSDLCPYVQGSSPDEVNGVWESTINNRKWDPYSKTYNEGCKAHPNFRWGNSQNGPSSGPPRGQFLQSPQGQQFNQQVPQQAVEQAPPSSSMSTEDMIRVLTLSVTQDRADNKHNFKNLENQNVSAVSLRNRRQLVEAEKVKRKDKEPVIHEVEEEIVIEEGERASIVKEKEQIPSPIPVVEPEELCNIKGNNKLKGVKKVKVSEHVSAMFQRKLPTKCSHSGMFTIPCTIGNTKIQKAMLDLGASINVMPYSLYQSMELGTLHATSVVIQLADRSNVYPKGIIEDVIVLVDNLIFPAHFYVLDMEHHKHEAPILLGMPFLKMLALRLMCQVALENSVDGQEVEYVFSANLKEVVADLHKLEELPLDFNNKLPLTVHSEKLLPSVLQAPVVELKALPELLKYIFLGEGETLPVIISSKLTEEQEARLKDVLVENKLAIGWTIADIKVISPSTCMHRILLEDDAKPVRQPQRRLNPL